MYAKENQDPKKVVVRNVDVPEVSKEHHQEKDHAEENQDPKDLDHHCFAK